MRVWIEIQIAVNKPVEVKFHPLMRVWIEIGLERQPCQELYVSPSYEGVD